MRITLGAIKEILSEYNKERGRSWIITDEMIHQIKEYFEDTKDYKGTPEDLVTDLYEEFLYDCEHEDYSVEDDSEDHYNGQGDYTGSTDYQYKICNICGAVCPILGVEQTGEGEYDEITGEWER